MNRGRQAARIAALFGFASVFGMAALAQPAFEPGCQSLIPRFEHLISFYVEAGREAIGKAGDVGEALEQARADNLAGKREASIRIVGVAIAMRLSAERYSVATIRQICTFADRNALPLHVISCAYFTGLNPMGALEDKRAMVERQLDTFTSLDLSALPEGQSRLFTEHAHTLRQCLA